MFFCPGFDIDGLMDCTRGYLLFPATSSSTLTPTGSKPRNRSSRIDDEQMEGQIIACQSTRSDWSISPTTGLRSQTDTQLKDQSSHRQFPLVQFTALRKRMCQVEEGPLLPPCHRWTPGKWLHLQEIIAARIWYWLTKWVLGCLVPAALRMSHRGGPSGRVKAALGPSGC